MHGVIGGPRISYPNIGRFAWLPSWDACAGEGGIAMRHRHGFAPLSYVHKVLSVQKMRNRQLGESFAHGNSLKQRSPQQRIMGGGLPKFSVWA